MTVANGKLWTASHDCTVRNWGVLGNLNSLSVNPIPHLHVVLFLDLEGKIQSKAEATMTVAVAAEKEFNVADKKETLKGTVLTEEEERELAELMGDDDL
jgi:hypothetical protein